METRELDRALLRSGADRTLRIGNRPLQHQFAVQRFDWTAAHQRRLTPTSGLAAHCCRS